MIWHPPRVEHHLAQVNVARLRAPLDAPDIADFVAGLDPINRLADASPGFVWRLESDGAHATATEPDDDLLIVNLSVWETYAHLHDFVYRTAHARYLRRRTEWFRRMTTSFVALWWVPVGHRPAVAEAQARLGLLQREGPTPRAFSLRRRFDPAGRPVRPGPPLRPGPAAGGEARAASR